MSADTTAPLLIVGSGGQGREVAQLVADLNRIRPRWDIVGFVDEREELHGKEWNRIPIVGAKEALSRCGEEPYAVCAIGSPGLRRKAAEELRALRPSQKFATLIHPTAVVGDDLQAEEGTIVCANVVLTTGVRIGRHVLIDYGVTVGHDAQLESYATLLPGCHVSGNVRIGEETSLGAGTVVIQNVTVGRQATIGAGSVVVRSLPDRCKAYGVPAKPVTAHS
ncbi:acetyltransferase [Cohnella hongkongensis]|uniref:Acetyltransferase n=1 Tax=Cohnella hongkongensis TaxID=178337 RepID=A0ABV9FHY2_9BACL